MDDDLRLLDVAIHRFRGFAGQDRLPLRFGNVTVLVGANGHGKTTVFDAIDWAMFGDAWRFAKTASDTDVTRGLRRPDQVPAVTVRFQNESVHTLARNGPKATWDGAAFDPSTLCRNFSVFAKSADLLRALRGITYLPQEHLRGLVASESGPQRQLMLAALAGVPFADRFDQNLRKTRGDLEVRKRTAEKDLSQVNTRTRELQRQLNDLQASGASNAEVLARVSAFIGQPTVDPITAAETVARRIQESRHAEQVAAARSQASRRLARDLEEIVATENELRAALSRASAERNEAKRLLAAAVEAERAFLEEQAHRLELLNRLGTVMEGARLSLQNAERLNKGQRALLRARAAVTASTARIEALTKELAARQQELDETVAASAAAASQLEQARAAFARATEREALLARRVHVEAQLLKLQQQRVDVDAVLARTINEAKEASERESLSRTRSSELSARLRQSLEGAERVAQIIAELLGLQRGDDPKCLVCGHDHGDGAARANAMRHQLKQAAELTELTKALSTAEAEFATASTQARSTERREKESAARASKIAQDQSEVVAELQAVSVQLAEYQGDEGTSFGLPAASLQERTKLANAKRAAVETARQNLKAARAAVDTEAESRRGLAAELETLTQATAANDRAVDEVQLAELRQAAARATDDLETERETVEGNSTLQATRALEIKRLRQQLSSLEGSVDAQTNELEKLSDRRSTVLRQIEDLGIKVASDTAVLVSALKATASASDEDANRSRASTAAGQVLQSPLAALSASSQIQVIERELTDLAATSAALTGRGAGAQAAQTRLDEIAAAVNKAITDSATGAIKNAEGRINEVLSELCPHQHLNVMRLAQDGVLLATDQANSPTVSPEYYGSTGQLGCMGLAVFLGIALGQRWSRLKMLLLDEPVQNMDDVNFVRFLDLIRRLAETHQVVVSTADKNIGELLKRKLLLWADGKAKTAIIHRFEAFDVEKGPTIVTEDLNRIRAVAG